MPVANLPWGASCSLKRSSNHYFKITTIFAKNPSCQTLEMRPRGRHRCRTCPRCGRAALQSLRSRARCRPRSAFCSRFKTLDDIQSSHHSIYSPWALESRPSTWKLWMEAPSSARAQSCSEDGAVEGGGSTPSLTSSQCFKTCSV